MARPTNSTAPTPSEKPPKIDLADQIADADGEEERQDRLGADDVARKVQHVVSPLAWPDISCNQRARQPAARNCSITRLTRSRRGRRRVVVLVFEAHRLPFERAQLVERLHLDPLDVLHRRDEAGDAFDIGGIVGSPGTSVKRTQTGLPIGGQPLGEAQASAPDRGRSPCDRCPDRQLLMSSRTRSRSDREAVVGAVAEKARRLDRRVQAHAALAPARIRRVKASCTIGSPPEIVRPPSSARSAGAKSPSRSMHLLAPRRRCRPSDARYRGCGSRCSAAGSPTGTARCAGRARRSATTSRRNGRSRTRPRRRPRARLRPARRARCPTRRSCRLPASRLYRSGHGAPRLRSGRGRCG